MTTVNGTLPVEPSPASVGPSVRRVEIASDRGDRDHRLDAVAREAHALAGADVVDMLRWTMATDRDVPLPGGAETVMRWELLATVAAQDLSLARVAEPHLDALAILAEDGQDPEDGSSWGVWAAEGPGLRLTATGSDATGWVLEGRKPWCSLAASVRNALVTAWVDDHERRLFAVQVDDPGLSIEDGVWAPAGLARVVTTPVAMTGVVGRPVGPTGWYLQRDGFAWGGIGVAAVWYGGAVGLARRLAQHLREREPDQVALMHLGEVDAALTAARFALSTAASDIDHGRATGRRSVLLGARVRHVVARSVEEATGHVTRALGPGPLSQDPDHVARVSDLALYLRQHHGERDAAGLGRLLLDDGAETPPW